MPFHVRLHVALLPETPAADRALVLLLSEVNGADVHVQVAAGRQELAAELALVAFLAEVHRLDVHAQVVAVPEALAAKFALVGPHVAHLDVPVELELVVVGSRADEALVRLIESSFFARTLS